MPFAIAKLLPEYLYLLETFTWFQMTQVLDGISCEEGEGRPLSLIWFRPLCFPRFMRVKLDSQMLLVPLFIEFKVLLVLLFKATLLLGRQHLPILADFLVYLNCR